MFWTLLRKKIGSPEKGGEGTAQAGSFHLHEVTQITVQGLRASQSSEASQAERRLRNAFPGESQNELIKSSKINPHLPALTLLWEHSLQTPTSIHAFFFFFFLPNTVLDRRDVDFMKVKGGCLDPTNGISQEGRIVVLSPFRNEVSGGCRGQTGPRRAAEWQHQLRRVLEQGKARGSHVWEGDTSSFFPQLELEE